MSKKRKDADCLIDNYQCSNGMESKMRLVNFTCPGCGAQLNVDADLKQATCQFCNMSFPIDDEAQHVKFDGAEQAGYDFEKGRQRAQQEQAIPQTVYVQVQGQQPKPKRKTWLWVLGWIFIFPIPLTIIMLKNESVKQKLDPKVRYGIIAVAWLLYFAIGVFGGGGDSSKKDTNSGSSAAVATQTSEASVSASSTSASASAPAAANQSARSFELDELQKAFCSLNDATTREDIDALIAENGFEVTKFTGDSGYYIGYEHKAITKRGRDREGEALDVNFSKDGIVDSAEYTVHTGSNTHYALEYKSGSFFYEGVKVESGEAAMQQYLASLPDQSTRASSSSNGIELIAGEKGEYGQELVMSEGTDMQENIIVYYVPAGLYSVQNLGDKPTQVSVYAGTQKGENGYDEYTEVGDVVVIEANATNEVTVPEGWFIEIQEPAHIKLTPKA